MDTEFGTEPNNVIGEIGATETKLESGRTTCIPRNRKASAGGAKVNIPHSALTQPSEDDLPGVALEDVIVLASQDLNGRRNAQTVLGTCSRQVAAPSKNLQYIPWTAVTGGRMPSWPGRPRPNLITSP